MNKDDVVNCIKKAVKLSHEHWQQTAEPIRPGSREESILVAEAMVQVLQDAIEQGRKEMQTTGIVCELHGFYPRAACPVCINGDADQVDAGT